VAGFTLACLQKSRISPALARIPKTFSRTLLGQCYLLNPHQSAYVKHHALLWNCSALHSHLDLSAAFDTIDHNILLTRLSSWFGIQGSALDWFKWSYHLAPSMLNVIITSIPIIPVYVVFLKVQFLVLWSSSSTLLFSVLLFHHLPWIITFMPMTHNFPSRAGLSIVPVVPWEGLPVARGPPPISCQFFSTVLTFEHSVCA